MDSLALSIRNDVSELTTLAAALEDLFERWELSPRLGMQVNLVLEELVTNTIFHGYADEALHHIDISVTRDQSALAIVVSDDGVRFDILHDAPAADIDAPLDERRVGGLGVHFVTTFMDRVSYEYRDGRNVVTMTKAL